MLDLFSDHMAHEALALHVLSRFTGRIPESSAKGLLGPMCSAKGMLRCERNTKGFGKADREYNTVALSFRTPLYLSGTRLRSKQSFGVFLLVLCSGYLAAPAAGWSVTRSLPLQADAGQYPSSTDQGKNTGEQLQRMHGVDSCLDSSHALNQATGSEDEMLHVSRQPASHHCCCLSSLICLAYPRHDSCARCVSKHDCPDRC